MTETVRNRQQVTYGEAWRACAELPDGGGTVADLIGNFILISVLAVWYTIVGLPATKPPKKPRSRRRKPN